MSDITATIEYVVRVKLPSSCGYHCSPSGDTAYEHDYNNAILSAKPIGFEVSWQSKDTWPKDKDGMTWVRLYCTDQKKAVEYFQDRAESLRKKVERMEKLLNELANS